jgi:hypothetical protein
MDPDYLDKMRVACQRQLDSQIPQALLYQSYYDGEPAILALLDTEERQVFRRFLDESQANWALLVVNAVAERMQVVAFEWGDSSDAAWAIWQANGMDADAELVQTDALVTGKGYVLVQPDDTSPAGVSITPESPFEATVLYKPGSNRRVRLAGYKRFIDPLAESLAEILILPDQIVTWMPGGGDPVTEPNPAGTVGLIEITPQPRTLGAPRSELDPAIPIQDRIHTTIFNRLVASDFGAFRQIWATGVKLARQIVTTTNPDGSTGTAEIAVKPWDIGANRLLTNENPEGRFGAFTGDPLSGYLASVEQDIQALAAITQTPPYYLQAHMVNLSADAIKAAEAGLVCKVRRRMLHIGECWETVIRLALSLIGDPGGANMAGEVLWADPETRSIAQLADALTKFASIGVPQDVLWQRMGATPAQIDSWHTMQKATLAVAQAGVPGAVPPGAVAAPPAPAAPPAVPSAATAR